MEPSETAVSATSGDDVISFVVQGGEHTLYFSKQRLMQHTPFFHAYFTRHRETCDDNTSGPASTTVTLKHVTAAAAEAALRLCHSKHHRDDALFCSLRRACAEATTAAARHDALRHVLSLYEACIKFELHRHAAALSRTAAAAVSEKTVLMVLRTCARYVSTLAPELRNAVELPALLCRCRLFLPSAWETQEEERRWRRLCTQYPELPTALERAGAAATGASAGNAGKAAPHVLWSPLRDTAEQKTPNIDRVAAGGGTAATSASPPPMDSAATLLAESLRIVDTTSTAPLPALTEVFRRHLRQTEELALAGQRRRREMAADVAALRDSGTALRARVVDDEAAAAASTQYLSEARVYLQALRAAESDMQALCAACVGDQVEERNTVLSSTAAPSTRLHVLRHQLERAAEAATRRRDSVEELLAQEQEALHSLDAELTALQQAKVT